MWVVQTVATKSGTSSWRGNFLLAMVGVLALLLLGASWFARQSGEERRAAEDAREHAIEVLQQGEALKVAALNMIRAERGYIITSNPEFLEPLDEARKHSRAALANLTGMTSSDPSQQSLLAEVRREYASFARHIDDVVAEQNSGDHARAVALIRQGEGRRSIEAILAQVDRIQRTERAALRGRSLAAARAAQRNEIYQYALSAIGLALIGFSLLTVGAVRRAVLAERAAREELRRIASTDELTGVANRRELIASLNRAVAQANRTGRPLAFAILDIDHFKQVNDTYGHPAGDEVIRHVAQSAVDTMRGQDTVGRLGGEEFAIVLPDCKPDTAFAACERLRAAIQNQVIDTGEAQLSITLSTGVASYRRGDDVESLMGRADAALYDAKRGGRDRVLMAA